MREDITYRRDSTLVAAAGASFPLKVCQSHCGFYIGTRDELGDPFSRESEEYWDAREDAETALHQQSWTQRLAP